MGVVGDKIRKNEKQGIEKLSDTEKATPEGGWKSEQTSFGKPVAIPKKFNSKGSRKQYNFFMGVLLFAASFGPIALLIEVSSEPSAVSFSPVAQYESLAREQAVAFIEGNYGKIINVSSIQTNLTSLASATLRRVSYPKVQTIVTLSLSVDLNNYNESYVFSVSTGVQSTFTIKLTISPPNFRKEIPTLLEYPTVTPSETFGVNEVILDNVSGVVYDKITEWADAWASNDSNELYSLSGDIIPGTYAGSVRAGRLYTRGLETNSEALGTRPQLEAIWITMRNINLEIKPLIFVSFVVVTCNDPEAIQYIVQKLLLIDGENTGNPRITDWGDIGEQLEEFSNRLPVSSSNSRINSKNCSPNFQFDN